VKVDDRIAYNPKIINLSDGAFRLYICALAYCQSQLTNGGVSKRVLAAVVPGARPQLLGRYARELVDQGLWEPDDQGWQIHDFIEFNRTSDHWKERRATDAERLRRWRSQQNGHDKP